MINKGWSVLACNWRMHILVESQDSKVLTLHLVLRLHHEDGIGKSKNADSTPKKNKHKRRVNLTVLEHYKVYENDKVSSLFGECSSREQDTEFI